MQTFKEKLSQLIHRAFVETAGSGVSLSDVWSSFEVPREERFGDLSTHLVLKLAKEKKTAPRPLADRVVAFLDANLEASGLGPEISKITAEGPGFINFYYSQKALTDVLCKIRSEKEAFGRPTPAKLKNICLEFVSANPTGPLTVAHGRQAALGDSLARILKFCGHRVHREYYNNDEGVQMTMLGRSIRSRCLTLLGIENPFPEDGYKGEYIVDLAKELVQKEGRVLAEKDESFFIRYGGDTILDGIKKDLADFGVSFDSYFSQAALQRSGRVERVLGGLKKKECVYESEGAVWFRSTRWGDDKDRVLVKSDHSYTYLLPDIAYHEDKLERKFDFLINILGPDHHGYIPRIQAAVQALGYPAGTLEILIAQLVTLFQGDKTMRMSTRAGEFITLREVTDEVGRDAGRFFFLMRKFDTHLDFDLALAKSQTPDNPVFYIQYAHARIQSIKKNFAESGGKWNPEIVKGLSGLKEPEEQKILRLLWQFEEIVAAAERTLEPYRLVPYLSELAGAFHSFYQKCRVVADDAKLTAARLLLVDSIQQVIRTGLGLLGVSAPTKM